MKNILFLLLCIGLFTQCKKAEQPNHSKVSKINKHHEAADEFYIQRSWPDEKLDFRAYAAAIYSAKAQLSEKNHIPSFDKPWTTRGPSNIGARVNTIAIHPQNHNIIYIGYSVGGVFKTTDGGENWQPIFDEQPFLTIGDIAIDPSNPETIYVGTGDPNISGYPFIGDGVYKSEDGGESWTNIGLTNERIVSKIIIDPEHPANIYVSCMGLPFERNTDRGLYKSTNGGESWTQILFANEQAGIIDMVMDPFDSATLYATAWDRIRTNQESTVAGPNAKVYKTIDGGLNWTMLEGGLPTEDMGRIGLAISTTEANTLYALYVSTESRLYDIFKSTDGGQNWTAILDWNSAEPLFGGNDPLGGFGWYFGQIRLNPDNPNEIFILGVDLWKSADGGLSWERNTPPWWQYGVHADKHDFVFLGTDTILLATDGGLYKATDTQAVWEDIESIATTQFYRVAYNPHQPDVYYGGAQDNGTTGGRNTEEGWERIYGGDGFQTIFHPTDTNIVYVETQRGGIAVSNGGLNSDFWDFATDGIDGTDRRNWDMPIIMSPHNPDILYTGTHRVYKNSFGSAPFWEAISEDLTDGLIFGNSFHTISTLIESPLEDGLLYVGTTDGNVWRSDDDGGEWQDISTGIPERYITDVKASPESVNRVFVSVSGYKYNDFNPHIFYSDDRGTSWLNISGDLPSLAVNDIYVLPGHLDSVLFVATDGGVYGSINRGDNWERLGNNMPIIPVYDLEWNQSRNELIAGTHARSIMSFPLDSLLDGIVATNAVILQKEGLKIFPSPAVNLVNIEIKNIIQNTGFELIITNIAGNIVLQKMDNQLKNIRVSQLSSGMYFVRITQGNRQWIGSFLRA